MQHDLVTAYYVDTSTIVGSSAGGGVDNDVGGREDGTTIPGPPRTVV